MVSYALNAAQEPPTSPATHIPCPLIHPELVSAFLLNFVPILAVGAATGAVEAAKS